MSRNVGTADRIFRVVGGLSMLVCSVLAPLPLLGRVLGFAVMGVGLLLSAWLGSCPVYRLLGKSSCAVEPRS